MVLLQNNQAQNTQSQKIFDGKNQFQNSGGPRTGNYEI